MNLNVFYYSFSVSVPVFSRCSSVASSDNSRSSPLLVVEFQGEMHLRFCFKVKISKGLFELDSLSLEKTSKISKNSKTKTHRSLFPKMLQVILMCHVMVLKQI